MKSSIFKTLEKLGQTSIKTRKIFSSKTRDKENIKVWKDFQSGVIYIDDFYTGDETYIEGEYRKNTDSLSTLSSLYHLESYEDV